MDDFHDQSLALPGLVGEECDQIWFVRDYVMVILWKKQITCMNSPQIEVDGVTYNFPEAGSRDALCKLIDKRVRRAVQFGDATVEIEFDDGLKLRVSPFIQEPSWEFIFIADRTW